VSSLRAMDVELERLARQGNPPQILENDAPWRSLDALSPSRELVQALALELQGGMHRRNLPLLALEAAQDLIHSFIRQLGDRCALDDRGFQIAGLGTRTEPHPDPVSFAGIQQPPADFRCVPEAD